MNYYNFEQKLTTKKKKKTKNWEIKNNKIFNFNFIGDNNIKRRTRR